MAFQVLADGGRSLRAFDNETSESMNIVAIHRSGAVSSDTACHRTASRHASARDRNCRRPVLPSTSPVNSRPERLGPASMASSA
jgi:hypothetical protein